ncbi:MAG: hypothetical protein AABX60_04160 [Nanoarchaeota archaeon]
MKPGRKIKQSLFRGKKGLDYYTVTVAVMGIFLLSFIAFSFFTKQYGLSSGLELGTEQFRILKTYAAAEKALLFVDDSARLALDQAAYAYGKRGLHGPSSPCEKNGDYNYWANEAILQEDNCVPKPLADCYPTEKVMKETFETFFTSIFASFVANFNSKSLVQIPFNYEPFSVEPVVGRTEIVGKSKEPITITLPLLNIKYEVKPSFREKIPIDIIANGKEVVAASQQLARLGEKETKKKLDEFNEAGKLSRKPQWSLVSYSKTEHPCTYGTGVSCKYTCGDALCDGTEKNRITYDEVSSLFSVTEDKKVLTRDAGAGKPGFKNLEYDFGLLWIEIKDSTTACT